MAMTTKKEKKQSKGPAGMTEKELKESKIGKRMSKKRFLEQLKNITPKTGDILLLKPEMIGKDIGFMKDGGEVKKYMGGGSVNKNKKNMITTKGWGASRKT